MGSEFKAVYNLHMRIDVMSTTLGLLDKKDVFHIVLEETVSTLETNLKLLVDIQAKLVSKQTNWKHSKKCGNSPECEDLQNGIVDIYQ